LRPPKKNRLVTVVRTKSDWFRMGGDTAGYYRTGEPHEPGPVERPQVGRADRSAYRPGRHPTARAGRGGLSAPGAPGRTRSDRRPTGSRRSGQAREPGDPTTTRHGSLQSRAAPQFPHTILHWRSSIRAPHRSQTCTPSVARRRGREAAGWLMPVRLAEASHRSQRAFSGTHRTLVEHGRPERRRAAPMADRPKAVTGGPASSRWNRR
jgi:hypothetical protein